MAENTEVRQLTNTITVNKQTYNVNAVHSDHADEAEYAKQADEASVAKKIENKLTINKVNLGDKTDSPSITNILEFDGHEAKSLDIVPSTGGRFRGRINVPNYTNKDIDAEAVLNYNDITTKVLTQLINRSTVYNWIEGVLTPTVTEGTINGISIVIGEESALNAFIEKNYSDKQLLSYLYISKDNGNLNYGTSDSNKATQLATIANILKNERTFITDLTKTSSVPFNGSANAELGIKGILPEANGGTGKNSLNDVKVGKATEADKLVLSTGSSINAQDVINLQDSVGKIINGTTTVTKSTNDSEGTHIRNNYYRNAIGKRGPNETGRRITISTDNPNDLGNHGADGDIWIVYKA